MEEVFARPAPYAPLNPYALSVPDDNRDRTDCRGCGDYRRCI